MAVTVLKPDITVLDEKQKTFEILELSVPFEANITARHSHKENKYAHFLSDITHYKSTVKCFEVGARGFLTSDNIKRLKHIHTLCKKTVKQKMFREHKCTEHYEQLLHLHSQEKSNMG